MVPFKNLLRWLVMTILSIFLFCLFDLLLMVSMIFLVSLPTWVWIVFGFGVIGLLFGGGIAICNSTIKWLIKKGPKSVLSSTTVKFVAVCNAFLIIGFWWFGNDKFSLASIVFRILMSGIVVLFTYLSVNICEEEGRELSTRQAI